MYTNAYRLPHTNNQRDNTSCSHLYSAHIAHNFSRTENINYVENYCQSEKERKAQSKNKSRPRAKNLEFPRNRVAAPWLPLSTLYPFFVRSHSVSGISLRFSPLATLSTVNCTLVLVTHSPSFLFSPSYAAL